MNKLLKHKLFIFSSVLLYFLVVYNGMGFLPRYASFSATTFIDNFIPLMPSFIIFYMIGYVFVALPVFFVKEKKEMSWLGLIFFLMLTFSFLMFMLVPIEMNKTLADGNGFLSKVTLLQQQVDTTFNNFPSLHVSLNLFAFLFIRDKNKKWGNYLFLVMVLIVISTLFVKQHLFVDVIGGVFVGTFFYGFYNKYLPRMEKSYELS